MRSRLGWPIRIAARIPSAAEEQCWIVSALLVSASGRQALKRVRHDAAAPLRAAAGR
jgi:hypothetical protein